jgi:short-subunit dehydrogenase
VTLAARSRPELEATAARIRGNGGTVVVVPVDVTDPAQRENLVRVASAELGPVDVLVNNAGLEVTSRLVDLEPAEVEQIIAVNLTAPMLLTRLVLPEMLERRRGHVVNIPSGVARRRPRTSRNVGGERFDRLLQLPGPGLSGPSLDLYTPSRRGHHGAHGA